MRRIVVLVMAVSLLGILLAATAVAKPAAKPHFVDGAFSGFCNMYDTQSCSLLTIGYQVTGLGNGGTAYIVVQGKVSVTVTCQKLKGGGTFKAWVDRAIAVNEHEVVDQSNGLFTGSDALRPNSVCGRNAVVVQEEPACYEWSEVVATLYKDQSRSGTPYDVHAYGKFGNLAC